MRNWVQHCSVCKQPWWMILDKPRALPINYHSVLCQNHVEVKNLKIWKTFNLWQWCMDAEKKRSLGIATSGKERKKQKVCEENKTESTAADKSPILEGAFKVSLKICNWKIAPYVVSVKNRQNPGCLHQVLWYMIKWTLSCRCNLSFQNKRTMGSYSNGNTVATLDMCTFCFDVLMSHFFKKFDKPSPTFTNDS